MSSIKMSNSTAELFSAVAKMQSELTNASKDKQAYGYKYADLAECLSTAKEPLSNNGLCVIQQMGMKETGENTLITTLAHSSGEYMQSETIIPKANLSGSGKGNEVQEMGAAITYMRRYTFAAIIGMTQEDTDGANNQTPPPSKKTPQNKPQAPTQDQTFRNAKSDFLSLLMKKLGSAEQCIEYCSAALGRKITKSDEITVQDLAIIKKYFENGNSQKQDFEMSDMPY